MGNESSIEKTTREPAATGAMAVPCCPGLPALDICDKLDFFLRLTQRTIVTIEQRRIIVPVEIKLHFRLTRCRGPLAIGDLLYTTTLLPGEKIRLFTSDRRTRYTFDAASSLSYRNTQTSEESLYMQSMSDAVFDTNSRDTASSSNQSRSHIDGKADAGIDLFGLGGSASYSGNFDASSTAAFAAEHSQHARSSHHATEQSVRKAASVSIGEVQSRSHAAGASEDHFESASRELSNPNRCRAITFLFYQINKTQTVRYTLEAVERRVILDPTHDFTKVVLNPLPPSGAVGVTSVNVLATDAARARVAQTGASAGGPAAPTQPGAELPPVEARKLALRQVDQELVNEGLLEKVGGAVSPSAQSRFSFEVKSALPTPGVIVKGCLDECDVCEPHLDRAIELELERKQLENNKLRREIELMEQDQQHRCCPAGAAAPASDPTH